MSQILRAAWRRIVLALLLVPGPAALGHEYKIGDHVVVTKAASLELVDRSVEDLLPGMGFAFEVEVDPVAPPGAMFEVNFIKGDRLVVSSGPLVWIDARNVIPLDPGPPSTLPACSSPIPRIWSCIGRELRCNSGRTTPPARSRD